MTGIQTYRSSRFACKHRSADNIARDLRDLSALTHEFVSTVSDIGIALIDETFHVLGATEPTRTFLPDSKGESPRTSVGG